MLDRRCASPAVNPTLFPGAQNGKAWTSTPGWAVDLADGAVLGSQTATDTNVVWLVGAGYTYGTGRAAVNGVCGSANGVATATAPVLGLCAVGTLHQFAGAGPWTMDLLGLQRRIARKLRCAANDRNPVLSAISATTALTATSDKAATGYWIVLGGGHGSADGGAGEVLRSQRRGWRTARGTGAMTANVAKVFTVTGL